MPFRSTSRSVAIVIQVLYSWPWEWRPRSERDFTVASLDEVTQIQSSSGAVPILIISDAASVELPSRSGPPEAG